MKVSLPQEAHFAKEGSLAGSSMDIFFLPFRTAIYNRRAVTDLGGSMRTITVLLILFMLLGFVNGAAYDGLKVKDFDQYKDQEMALFISSIK